MQCVLDNRLSQFTNSPQFNGRIERKFATLYGKTRATLNGAEVSDKMRSKLWAEAANNSTETEMVLCRDGETSPYEKFYKKELAGWRNMRKFGEIGIVSFGSEQNKQRAKHLNRGRPCMYLSLAPNRPQDTF